MTNITINSLPTYSGTSDHVNDIIPIYDYSTASTTGISVNNLITLSSQAVGLTDSQTLTNKTLTTPAISAPVLSGTVTGTYTLGGTPTFPATIVTTTGSQTLTNKTLTSPTINSATISNPTLSVDTITGYSVATNVTAGGVTLNNGAVGGTTGTFSSTLNVTGAGTVGGLLTASNGLTLSSGTLTLPNNSIVAANLATSAITLGYAQVATGTPFTTTSTGYVAVTGLTVNVTIPAGGRRVKVTAYTYILQNSAGTNGSYFAIYSGASSGALTTQLSVAEITTGAAGGIGFPATVISVTTPSAGSIWFTAAHWVTGGTGTVSNLSGSPAFILVEAI